MLNRPYMVSRTHTYNKIVQINPQGLGASEKNIYKKYYLILFFSIFFSEATKTYYTRIRDFVV
jgi:hypothetical protein